MGVRSFAIADPEIFEPENINRVPGANISTIGKNKAEVFRDMVFDINEDAEVRVFNEGITTENVDEFMKEATLVFDETELTRLELGTMVSDAARERGIPDVFIMNVGFAAQITSFHPDSKHSFRSMMGIPKDMPLNEVREQKLDISRCLPYLPTYADARTLQAVVEDDDAPLPSIAPGVDIASGLGASQAFLHITQGVNNNRPDPIWAPKFGYMDAYTLESGTTRLPRVSFMRRFGMLMLRQKLGMNPEASFTSAERTSRHERDNPVTEAEV
jgi:molybdopterin/thiamine biosynthesis adenylyltransferase